MDEIIATALQYHARYVLPFLIGLIAILLADNMIDLVYRAIGGRRNGHYR